MQVCGSSSGGLHRAGQTGQGGHTSHTLSGITASLSLLQRAVVQDTSLLGDVTVISSVSMRPVNRVLALLCMAVHRTHPFQVPLAFSSCHSQI